MILRNSVVSGAGSVSGTSAWRLIAMGSANLASVISVTAGAADTRTYTYDPRGRLVGVQGSNGIDTVYSFDNADNRIQVVVTGAVNVPNGSFEEPSLSPGPGAYVYNPHVAQTAFTGYSGVAAYGSAWGFPPSPDGNQVGFLQTAGDGNPGVITLLASGLVPGRLYVVKFRAVQRPLYENAPITISVGGQPLSTILPSPAFTEYASSAFTANASALNVTFSVPFGTPGVDAGVGIDLVQVVGL